MYLWLLYDEIDYNQVHTNTTTYTESFHILTNIYRLNFH